MSCQNTTKQPLKNMPFRRAKTHDRDDKDKDPSSLEKMACLSLCELSESIDVEQMKGEALGKQ